MSATPNGVPCLTKANPVLNGLAKATSKFNTIKEMRAMQEHTLKLVHSHVLEEIPMCDDPDRPRGEKSVTWMNASSMLCSLIRAYCDLRDRIRIEKGLIRPGSRNESVRVEPKEPARRGRGRGVRSASQTLASAAAELGITPTGQVTGPPAIEVESVNVSASEQVPNKPV